MNTLANFPLTQGHLALYPLASIAYFILFAAVVRTLIKKSLTLNPTAIATAGLFLCLALFFLLHGFFSTHNDLSTEILLTTLGLLPAVTFFLLRRQTVLLEQSQSARRFDQMKEDFLSVASHELRTPLSVINGFAEVLVREKLGTLNDEQKRRVRKILMQGQRLNRIVDELLDLSRIRSGKVDVRKELFDLIPVLKACMDDHQIVCEQQKIELHDKIPDTLPDIYGDLERVTQVVVNLLNNAIKYTEAGGSITLTAEHDAEKNEIKVSVIDTGIGIEPKDQVRLFEEFYRVNHQYARKFSGSGLGLAIVKQLIGAQGGRVGAFSEGQGKGTTFFFTLPVAKIPKESDKLPPKTHSTHFDLKSLRK